MIIFKNPLARILSISNMLTKGTSGEIEVEIHHPPPLATTLIDFSLPENTVVRARIAKRNSK